MSKNNREYIIINGSPKTAERSVSGGLATLAESFFQSAGLQTGVIHVRNSLRNGLYQSDFEDMHRADALVLIFPLYYFCLPAVLMRFLEDYAAYLAGVGGIDHGQAVYAVVNCGFPEPDINKEAIRVVESFARHIGAVFHFGVSIGSGGMIAEAGNAPFMKKAIAQLNGALKLMAQKSDNANPPADNVSIAVSFPRRLYYFMGNRGWFAMARKNGLTKKALYARPYQTI